jgi:uncharacterized phage infection (PIP) family protein YhgE
MRRVAMVLALLLVAQLALSVEVSEAKLAELITILERYSTITEKLSVSLTNSETRINDLQTGFDQYKATVDVLLEKAKRQECQIIWLKVGIGVSLGAAVGLGLWAALK